MLQVAREDADRLSYLISNLLNMSRIEAGAIKLLRRPSDVEDLIGVALGQLGSRLGNRQVTINLPAGLAAVYVDFSLIVLVLVNLLDNANKFSPASLPIEISAQPIDRNIEIQIADRGTGIPREDLPYIFDKFYRLKTNRHSQGTGLGLFHLQRPD